MASLQLNVCFQMRRWCAGFVVLMCVAAVFWALLKWDSERVKDWGIRGDAPNWLPRSASEVTFLETGAKRIAEFKIGRSELFSWCNATGMGLGGLMLNEEEFVERPNLNLARHDLIPMRDLPKEGGFESESDAYQKWSQVRLHVGDYYYSHGQPHTRGYTLAYDSNKGICYYLYSKR